MASVRPSPGESRPAASTLRCGYVVASSHGGRRRVRRLRVRGRSAGGAAGVDADRSWQSYRFLADNAIDVVLEADLHDGDPVDLPVRRRTCSAGTPGELVGRYAADIVHPDDVAEVGALAQALSEQGARVRTARVPPADEGGRVQGAAATGTPGRGRGRSRRRPHHHDAGHQRARRRPARPVGAERGQPRARPRRRRGRAARGRCARPSSPSAQYPLVVVRAARLDDATRRGGRRRRRAGRAATWTHITVTWDDGPLGRGATGPCHPHRHDPGASRLHGRPRLRPVASRLPGCRAAAARSRSRSTCDGEIDGALMVYADGGDTPSTSGPSSSSRPWRPTSAWASTGCAACARSSRRSSR